VNYAPVIFYFSLFDGKIQIDFGLVKKPRLLMVSLPKHKYLLTYRYAEIIHDGVVSFRRHYLGEIRLRRTCE